MRITMLGLCEFLYKLRFVFGGAFIVLGVFLLSLIISSMEIGKVQAKEAPSGSPPRSAMAQSPNAVTSSMARAAHNAGQTIDTVAYAAAGGIHTTATVIAQGGTLAASGMHAGAVVTAAGIGKGAATIGHGVRESVVVAGRAIGSGAGFVFRIPGNAVGFANTAVVQNVIRPADDTMEVPIIDPGSPELHAAIAAMPPDTQHESEQPQAGSSSTNAGPAWPMHGRVTAEFGIPHWPFQPTHTGIDISSGQPAGVTPIKPFRAGTVIDAVHSSRGLGNHVIVDHGNGVTSVYAHLDSIAVQAGQTVDIGTVVGLEGTTGLSTGPHLHFEIRVNGHVANPRQFIDGNP